MNTNDFPELEHLREMINQLDIQLVTILAKRVHVCRTISRYKKKHNIPVMQPARIAAVKSRCEELAMNNELDKEFINRLYDVIIQETCRIETVMMEIQHE